MERLAVVEDGIENQPSAARSPSKWLMLTMAAALGVGLWVVVFSTPDTGQPTRDQGVIPLPDMTTTAGGAESLGLGSVVPGWTDTLVAIGFDESGELTHVTWRPDSKPVEDPMTPTGSPRSDAGGLMIASLVPHSDTGTGILMAGRFDSMRQIASDVSSFAWHDGDAGKLAYTTINDGRWVLWVADLNGNQSLTTSREDDMGDLVTWGDWGFALQTAEGDMTLFTRRGDLKTVRSGTVFDSDLSGWIAVVDERVELVSSGGGTRMVDVSLEALGTVYEMAFSPDGESLAISASDGMGVVPLRRDGQFIRFEPGLAGFTGWSTDQRYVLFTAPDGVFIQDLAAGTRHHILESYSVVDVAAISETGF